MPTYDVARARISKPRFQVWGLQGEGNVGEARAAARRTRSPTLSKDQIRGRTVGGAVSCMYKLRLNTSARRRPEARRGYGITQYLFKFKHYYLI